MINISRREFIRLVRQAYEQIPPPVKKALRNVDIAVEEWPDPSALASADSAETLLGLYVGVPLPERQGGDPQLPDRIVIFRQPILRSYSTRREVEHEIHVTLLHEVGHCLGMEEEDLHRLGYG